MLTLDSSGLRSVTCVVYAIDLARLEIPLHFLCKTGMHTIACYICKDTTGLGITSPEGEINSERFSSL